jgi:hypothetical protein
MRTGDVCLPFLSQAKSSNTIWGPKVGTDFPIAHAFVAHPKKFEKGGSVIVLADPSRSLVMVHVYIE